jgi:hypothetical protein
MDMLHTLPEVAPVENDLLALLNLKESHAFMNVHGVSKPSSAETVPTDNRIARSHFQR